jgi:hypothetical protein
MMHTRLLVMCLAGAVAAACTAPTAAGDAPVGVTDRHFFVQCPLVVAAPSVTLVSTAAAWQQMLAGARTSPPPFVASATSFDKQSVLIVATASTPTPRTQLAVKADAVTLNTSTQRLRVAVDVSTTPGAEMGAAVVGEPCLVLWTARMAGATTVRALDAATGALIAETRAP